MPFYTGKLLAAAFCAAFHSLLRKRMDSLDFFTVPPSAVPPFAVPFFAVPSSAVSNVIVSGGRSLLLATVAIALSHSSTQAQSIIPAADGTGTAVSQQGHHYTIESGSYSADGANLFHSFNAFSLSAAESAAFLAQPETQNILARINSGAPSILNGQLQISGGAPNLFLMNPAGVLFGADAQINLPGNFTVTTADAIGFGQNALSQSNWFSATGTHSYSALSGEPNAKFVFSEAPLGSIVNEGTISVPTGASLTLLGGSVVNTGTLFAPEGNITVAASPNEGILRLSQTNSLLSIEIDAETARQVSLPISSLTLPQLLTYSASDTAQNLRLNADGSATISGLLSAQISAQSGVDTGGTGGNITVVASQIDVADAQILASGQTGGGTIRLGGNYRGAQGLPTARQTAVDSDSVLAASAIAQGNGGSVIVWADEIAHFAGQIEARGGQAQGDGGFVEVSGKQALLFRGEVDASASNGRMGSLLLDPENITITNIGANDEELADASIFSDDGSPGSLFTISEAVVEGLSGNADITLEATGDIFIESLENGALSFSPGVGSVTLAADTDGVGGGDISDGGSNYAIQAPGRSLSLSGVNVALGDITTAGFESGGEISVQAEDSITLANLGTSSPSMSGDISLLANNNITTQFIDTSGGDVTVSSTLGAISITDILASNGTGIGGSVDLSAQEDIDVSSIDTAASGLSGSISATSGSGSIDIASISSGSGSNAGSVDLLAPFGSVFANGELISSQPEEAPIEPSGEGFSDEDFSNEDFSNKDFSGEDFSELDDDYFYDDDVFFDDSSDFDAVAAEENILSLDEFGDELDEISDELDELDDELEGAGDEFDEFDAASGWELDTLDGVEASEELYSLERNNKEDFSAYFGRSLGGKEPTPAEIRQLLEDVQERTGSRSAIVYVKTPLVPLTGDNSNQRDRAKQTATNALKSSDSQSSETSLELLLFTADQPPIKISIPAINIPELAQSVQQFRSTLALSARRNNNSYLTSSQQLYQTLIAPVEAALADKNIDTLMFSMSAGLRTLPVAALHDGDQFLVEKYALSVVPSLSLIDTRQSGLGEAQVLAMGVSEFDQLAPLPAVPIEVDIINQLWPGAAFLNESSTRNNLVEQRQQSPYQVIHLATHADFKPGKLDNSYIQLWDEQIRLSELHRLGWEYPAVDLLVLSACSTAVGSPEAEMGFAGLAIASGVRSAMASLWPVSDIGTLGLMSEFYGQLKYRTVKVEALRSAQLAMLQGAITSQGGQLTTSTGRFSLPAEPGNFSSVDLSHPYYWAGFTMIGSPW